MIIYDPKRELHNITIKDKDEKEKKKKKLCALLSLLLCDLDIPFLQ